MTAKSDASIEKARAALLDAAIENTAFDGFTPKAIEEAARQLKIAPETAALAFPGGPKDLLRAWSEKLDDETRAELEAAESGGPWKLASESSYDDVIDPRELRAVLIGELARARRSETSAAHPVRRTGYMP